MTKRLIAGVVLAGLLMVGCGDTDSGIPNQEIPSSNIISNQPVVVNPPVAGSFSFSTGRGGQVVRTAANGLLSVGTPNGATVVNVQSPTTLGGNVTANADGSFTYNAPAQVGVTDSFSFTIRNSAGNSTGTANVSLTLPQFFVNNQAAAGGDGSQAAPFQTLAQAQTAATGINGAEIVVFQGDGTSNGYNTALALGGNQTLRGFSQAARPVLTGPINCAGGNQLEDLSFANTVRPINSVNASNSTGGGVVNRVSFSNIWSGCNVTDAVGNWQVANCSFANVTNNGVVRLSTVGNLSLSVTNSSFAGQFTGVISNASGSASGTFNVADCGFTGGAFAWSFADTQSTRVDVRVHNCTLEGAGLTPRGIDVNFGNTTQSTVQVTNNNSTNFSIFDIGVKTFDNSNVRALIDGNRVQGNTAFLNISADQASQFCAVVRNNIFDLASIQRFGSGLTQIENFANFGTVNTGTLTTRGTITDVPVGTCGFP